MNNQPTDVRYIHAKIGIRNDTLENWIIYDPILLEGEIGIITDKKQYKVGNGESKFSELPLFSFVTADSDDNIVLDNKKISGLAYPEADADAATKKYVDDTVIDVRDKVQHLTNQGTLSTDYITQGNSRLILYGGAAPIQ